VVELSTVAGPHRELVLAALRRGFGLGDETQSTKAKRRPAAARWVIDRAGERAFLDEVELRLPSLAFRLLVLLAQKAGEVIPGKDLSLELSPNRSDTQAAKEAKRRLKQAIEAGFQRARRRMPRNLDTLLEASRKGYCLRGGVSFK
jgi:DNA-binding response OmpR family regulator